MLKGTYWYLLLMMLLLFRWSFAVNFTAVRLQVLIDDDFMAQWALKFNVYVQLLSQLPFTYLVLNIKPLPKTHAMEVMFASCDLC